MKWVMRSRCSHIANKPPATETSPRKTDLTVTVQTPNFQTAEFKGFQIK
jgi:hypothetical protein